MKIPIYQIDAFAESVFTGNPAAVCPLEYWLPDRLLQSIAQENNLSETAFYVPGNNYYEIRWFTPNNEVDLCGHATLAAAHVLFMLNKDEKDRVTFQSHSGLLHVIKEDPFLTLDFPAQAAVRCDIPEGMTSALGAKPQECYRAVDYMLVFDNEEEIVNITPDFRRLKNFDLRGVIVTAKGNLADFVSRFFAPKCGVDEDPVTGSAHCMLAPYWTKRLGKSSLTARQLSKRTGTLQCRVDGERVYISGRTVAYMQGTIKVE